MSNVFYLVLRQMRFPLILLVVVYAGCVLGMSLMPGVDDHGAPAPGMSLFEAFYVMSYTGTTIGFGELPHPYSGAQRMWMTLSIYLTVLAWSFSVVNVLALLQEPGFQATVRNGRFARRVRTLREPFYIVCGVGETGTLVCRALDRLRMRCVVIESDPAQLQEFRLEELHQDVPVKVADASRPSELEAAGLLNPYCRGVMALTSEDASNQSIAVAVRLLAPDKPVLARLRDLDRTSAMKGPFVGDRVINPFERFAEHLVAAVAAPERYRLREVLTGLTGDEFPERHYPPRGRWIMCGYGRFGHAVVSRLEEAGFEVCVIDRLHYGEPGVDVRGSGTEIATLREAGIDRAAGIVVGNSNDLKNLAIAMNARALKPDIFIVTRQNQDANSALFHAFADDLSMVPSRIVAREFLALITTPMVSRMLELLPEHDEQWCSDLTERLARIDQGRIPEIDALGLTSEEAPAARWWLKDRRVMTLRSVLTDPRNRRRRLEILVLLVLRAGEVIELPADDFRLKRGDHLLLAGRPTALRRLKAVVANENLLTYTLTGHDQTRGWIFEKVAQWQIRRRKALIQQRRQHRQ